MNTHDKLELPPLPDQVALTNPKTTGITAYGYTSEQMESYARAAIEHFLNQSGQYITNAATRQAAIDEAIEADRKRRPSDAEAVCAETYQVVGSLLSDLGVFETEEAQKALNNLSEARLVHKDVLPWPSFERRGEPVDIRQEVIETLEMILVADWRKWEELASPDEFVRWAKSRANYALSIINEAPQPAEPVKVRPETTSEHIARDIREGRFPDKSERQTIPAEPVEVPSEWEDFPK